MVLMVNRNTDSLSMAPLAHMDNPTAAPLHHSNRAAIMAGSNNHHTVDSNSIITRAVTMAAVILDSTVKSLPATRYPLPTARHADVSRRLFSIRYMSMGATCSNGLGSHS